MKLAQITLSYYVRFYPISNFRFTASAKTENQMIFKNFNFCELRKCAVCFTSTNTRIYGLCEVCCLDSYLSRFFAGAELSSESD